MTSTWTISPWRDLSTAALLAEQQCRSWDLADIDANPEGWSFAPESREFLVYSLRELNGELTRRKRLASSPLAPKWGPEPRDRRAELEEIKRKVTLIDLIHSQVWREYERRGPHDVWCCCPLPGHEEKSPSFHIDERQQVWHCFGCGRGGDLFELARHLWSEGLFYKVADRLRELAGIATESSTPIATGPSAVTINGMSAPVKVAAPRRRPAYGR